MRYFDSRDGEIGVKHIMASGALPPAFPAVRIDGELYWDGGILSNTPTEVIFDDDPRRNSLIFAVHLWNPMGDEPRTIWEVLNRQKDIQYSSRVASHIARQRQMHNMRHVVRELARLLPEEIRTTERARALAAFGCHTTMHVVRLLAPRLENENHTKDVDFGPSSIRMRWEAGFTKTMRVLEQAPWEGVFDAQQGVLLHEPEVEMMQAAE
jgi:NTE family protein